MNSTRKEIVSLLNSKQQTTDLFETMKSCINLDLSKHNPKDIDNIDEWFYDCIKSLFFRPSGKSLILIGKQQIGKSTFVRNLLFEPLRYSYFSYDNIPNLHLTWIADVEDAKTLKDIINTDGFIINSNDRYPYGIKVDKRLCNPVHTAQYLHYSLIERKKHIVIYIESIDIPKFLSIDKRLMWIEIYNKFLNNNGIFDLFSQNEIDNFYE